MNGTRCYSIHDVSNLSDEHKLRIQNAASQYISQPTLAINDVKLNKSSLSLKSSHSGVMYKKDVFFTGSIKSIKDDLSK